ncbi:uncharacterized protein LOC126778600 isoform X2 [Nymphalis io]|uniref:uncharacterized protein LOC126778600 isoform X2 n=1 Tax=Inachis io TaxID=171585 RepID=UPI00216A4F64|nr:uncharacterized protein LOC126778600 isoform X2 [Nymphalis io]
MKVLVVLGFCFAVASATPAKHLNLGREPVPAERSYYGKSYDLGTLGFRYYAPYYYDTPYYGYGDGYYNNYYTNRYYKTPYYGDKTQYYGDKTQYYGDKTPYYGDRTYYGDKTDGYTTYKQYRNPGYLRQQDDEDDNQR